MTPANETENDRIDVLIPYHDKDRNIIPMCVQGCAENIKNLGTIYVVGNNPQLELNNVTLIDDNHFFDDRLSKEYIESRWTAEYPALAHRAGWLFQQFIKMGCPYSIPSLTDYYLVVDADVVFLKMVRFFHNGQMLLAKSGEFHEPYFKCYERLLGEPPNRKWSFISHHLIISKAVMLELLRSIEERFNRIWYDAILDNIDYSQGSPFSEYETYGHYLQNHHPEKFITRELVYFQKLKLRHIFMIALNRVDYVALHSYKKINHNSKTLKLLKTIMDLKTQQKGKRHKT
jgi:hypothetical protein